MAIQSYINPLIAIQIYTFPWLPLVYIFFPLSAIVVTFLLIHHIHRYRDRLTARRLHWLPPSVRRPCVSSPLSHVRRPRTHGIADCLASLTLVVS